MVGWVGGGSALATDPSPATHLCRIQDTRNMLHLKRMDSGFICHGGQVGQRIAETSKGTTILGRIATANKLHIRI